MSADLRVSLVYGVEVPRGTPAAAFAGNDAVRFVQPFGATYPVVYAASSAHRVDGVLNIGSVTTGRRVGSEMLAWMEAVLDACKAAHVRLVPGADGWMVVCDVC